MVSKKIIVFTILIIFMTFMIFYVVNGRNMHRLNFFYSKSYRDKVKNLPPEPEFRVIEEFNIDPSIEKVFTTSLYGDNPVYFNGLESMVKDIEERFPEWRLRLYLHDKVNFEIREKLKLNPYIQLVIVEDPMAKPGNSAGAFWRFLPLCEDITFICVDADDEKIMIPREYIEKWMNEDCLYYNYISVFNFPWPKDHFAAGRWGRKRTRDVFNCNLITGYPLRTRFGSDEIFLYEYVIPDSKKTRSLSGFQELVV